MNEPEDVVICKYSGQKDKIKYIGRYSVVLYSGQEASWAGLHKYYLH